MIANITQGGSLAGIILYNQKKVINGEAQVLSVENCIDDTVDTAKHLMLNLALNSVRKDKFFHVSLNFPQSDKAILNDHKLRSIALEYLNQLGFPDDHPSIIYKHDDTEHPHLHIVTSKILVTGRPIKDSHLKRRSQSLTRKLEKKYDLTRVASEKQERKMVGQGSGLNNRIRSEVDLVMKRYQPKNIGELNRHLQLAQLKATIIPKEENHNENSVGENIVFHRTDTQGHRIDKGIKASSLHENLLETGLDNEFKKNRRRDPRRLRIQRTVNNILGPYDKLNIDEFAEKLLKGKIQLRFKLDKSDNLVGISYTDLRSDIKYTGENLGQRFKAKSMARKLTQGRTIINPEKLTDIGLRKIRDKLLGLDDKTLVKGLLLMGYRLKVENSVLLINDFRNGADRGYVALKEISGETDKNIINHNIDSLKIILHDNSQAKLFFQNRRSFAGDNGIKFPALVDESPVRPRNIIYPDGETGKAGPVRTYNSDEHTISDFDKKKKKGRGRGI